MVAVAGEVGLFCTLRAKRCRQVQSPSLSVTAALAAGTLAKVAPASLTAWRRMAGRLVKSIVLMAGQAALGKQVHLESDFARVEAVVALEDKGRQEPMKKVVTVARAFNQTYPVPPILMAAAAAAAAALFTIPTLAMEDWAEVLQERRVLSLLRVQPSQGAEVVAVDTWITGVQAAPASSSSATRRKPPARRR